MISKKVIRYYADCGRGFWSKRACLHHENVCQCWKNPKFKTCLTCVKQRFVIDSNGMEHEPQLLQTWVSNMCDYADNGTPVHENYEHIIRDCTSYEQKIKR